MRGSLMFLGCCMMSLAPHVHIHRNAAGERQGQTELILLGSIGYRHLEDQGYPAESLRDIAVACMPDVILVEFPVEAKDPCAPIPIESVRRTASLGPEIHVAAEVADRLGAQLVSFDTLGSEAYLKRYAEHQDQAHQKTQAWMEWLSRQKDPDKVDLGTAKLACHVAQSLAWYDSPRNVNFAGFDAVVRDKYFLYHELMPQILKKYASFKSVALDWKRLADEWASRNRMLARNIDRLARAYSGRRLLIIIGAEHRYILRDLLQGRNGVIVKEYWEIAQPMSVGVIGSNRSHARNSGTHDAGDN